MNITTLQERITKANAKIEKKQNTITKKTAQIEKKMGNIVKKYNWDVECTITHVQTLQDMGYTYEQACEISDTICDVNWLNEDIRRGAKEIEETRKTIAKYEAQLAGEIERESLYIREVPESMKQMQAELERVWNEFDEARKADMYEAYKQLGYRQFFREYTYADYELIHKSIEDIHKDNARDAKMMVLNLLNRVKGITGDVTDWANIECTYGTHGMPTLNGIVYGKEGRARVESITAGGYNIQRFHIRVLVKSF